MKILVTGAAGFIGFHLSQRLLDMGHNVVGLDNVNDYYDVNLKFSRLNELGIQKEEAEVFLSPTKSNIYGGRMTFIRMNLEDRIELPKLFNENSFDLVCNLAAQAGVRYSLENPQAYIESNINGFLNILECCRNNKVKKLVYASSSSVYGDNDQVPFKEGDNVDHPISLYAATKKSNELMAHTYSHLYDFQTIGLRFFTVYGPWGRPDMAMFLFTDAIIKNKPIKVFNNGDLSRDFTYIDDIIDGVVKTLLGNSKNTSKYQLYNIGNSKPIRLLDFISEVELNLNKKADKVMMPMQDGDVSRTWADLSEIKDNFHYNPKTSIKEGVANFTEWFKSFYNQ
jgi:UDP-glucuronate 4-epimerase